MESTFIAAQRRRPGHLPSTTDVRFYLLCVHGLGRSIILLQGVFRMSGIDRSGVHLRYLAWQYEAYNIGGYSKRLDAMSTGAMCIWYIE